MLRDGQVRLYIQVIYYSKHHAALLPHGSFNPTPLAT